MPDLNPDALLTAQGRRRPSFVQGNLVSPHISGLAAGTAHLSSGPGSGPGSTGQHPIQTHVSGNSVSRQQFLELVFDMTLLEKVSHLCKESKDELGMRRVQDRISSHRLALDAAAVHCPLPLQQKSIRDQIHYLAEQDLLTLLWSKYARIG
jgi:hypothetical protein